LEDLFFLLFLWKGVELFVEQEENCVNNVEIEPFVEVEDLCRKVEALDECGVWMHDEFLERVDKIVKELRLLYENLKQQFIEFRN